MKLTLPPAVKLRGGIIASRLGWAALVALVSLLSEHGLPGDVRTLLAWGVAAVGAMIAALPSAFLAAGIVRPVSPEFASLCQRLGQLFSRPGIHPADVQAAVAAELRVITPQLIHLAADEVENRKFSRTNMDGYSAAELAQPGTDGPNDPDAPAAAPTPSVEAITATADTKADAITQIGGNQ